MGNNIFKSKDRKKYGDVIALELRERKQAGEPRPEGRRMIWKGLRTPSKCGFELPGLKGPGFLFLDETAETQYQYTPDMVKPEND